jgi:hypothetical protein
MKVSVVPSEILESGGTLSQYADTRTTTRRNLYRIPLSQRFGYFTRKRILPRTTGSRGFPRESRLRPIQLNTSALPTAFL